MSRSAHRLARWLACLALFLCSPTLCIGEKGPPDVLIVVAHQQGWGELSMRGNPRVSTPHLDEMAASGLELTRFYSTPAAATSFASLLTGRYHYRTGAVGGGFGEHVVHSYETTLGEIFREGGYRTGFFGQWKNGENWPHCAEAQGFEHIQRESDAESVAAFFDREEEAPKMALLSCESFASAEAWMGKLNSLRGRDDFLVIYLADSGPSPSGNSDPANARFYGEAGSVHEGGVRVPCFISYSPQIPPGSRFDRITSVIDWFPTLAAICGLNLPEEVELDGIDLTPALFSGGEPRRWPNRILFTSMTPEGFDLKNASVSVRTDRWLAVRDSAWCRDEELAGEFNGWELYDLVADPFERFNVSQDYPFLISDLKADYSFWMDQTTRFGLKIIPTEIGHPEWPTVKLSKSARSPKGEWPVQVVNAGEYRIEVDGDSVTSLIVNGELKTFPDAIALSEKVTTIRHVEEGESDWETLTLTRQ